MVALSQPCNILPIAAANETSTTLLILLIVMLLLMINNNPVDKTSYVICLFLPNRYLIFNHNFFSPTKKREREEGTRVVNQVVIAHNLCNLTNKKLCKGYSVSLQIENKNKC